MTDVPVWERGDRPAWPALERDIVADVCVVGLGGSGLSAIDEALSHGASVVGLDAAMVGARAAGRNGGFLKAGLTSPLHRAEASWGESTDRVYRRTLEEIERVFGQAGPDGWQVGSIRLATTPEEEADIERHLSALGSHGLPGEPWEGPAGRGIYFPVDGGFNPLARCRRLALDTTERGASLFERSRAQTIEPGAVLTDDGSVTAELVIVAVDGSLETLFPELGVRTTRLQMLATAPDPDVDVPCPVYADFGFNYWQQLPDGSIAIGGARHLHEAAEWTSEPGVSDEVQADIEAVLRNRIGSSADVTHRWSGHAAYTADGIPVGREVEPGVWVVGAYNGVGNVLGAVYAREAVRSGLGPGGFGLPDSGEA